MDFFLGTATIFLPSPMLARKVLASKPRFFVLAAADLIRVHCNPERQGFKRINRPHGSKPGRRELQRSEPFCTVCRREVSDPKAGSRKQFTAKPDGLSTFLRQGLPRSRGSGQPPIIQECNASQKSN